MRDPVPAKVGEALSKCNSFADFIDLMISRDMQTLGMEREVTVEDIRAW